MMPEKVSSNLIFYALAEIRFNTIKKMEDYVPTIQDDLRKTGYPDFKEDELTNLNIRSINEQVDIDKQKRKVWAFINSQNTEGYILAQNGLVFHTTNYEGFNNFLEKMIKGIDLLHDKVTLSYIDRIGLRYVNVLNLSGDKKIEELINPSLSGLYDKLQPGFLRNFNETLAKINDGMLVSRSIIIKDELALPPDLLPLKLKPKENFLDLKGINVVLDTDYFVEKRLDFNDSSSVKDQLLKSHEIVKENFINSISEKTAVNIGIKK